MLFRLLTTTEFADGDNRCAPVSGALARARVTPQESALAPRGQRVDFAVANLDRWLKPSPPLPVDDDEMPPADPDAERDEDEHNDLQHES